MSPSKIRVFSSISLTIKFGLFLNYAINELNVDFIASGHYARIRKENNRYLLLKGADPLKDQSYMLYTLTQDVLSRLIFPLGEYKKGNVRIYTPFFISDNQKFPYFFFGF